MKLILLAILTSHVLAVKVHRSQHVQSRSDLKPRSIIERFLDLVEYYREDRNANELRNPSEDAKIFDIGPKEKLVEGDMIITKEQDEMTHGPVIMRKARDMEKYIWPQGKIPYAIDPTSEDDRQVIEEAIRMWEENTCLTFPKVQRGSSGTHIFFAKGRGCNSHVGRVADTHPNGQMISIGEGCATPGIVAHEIGHAIGFYHEQSRTDRDEYIKIVGENIIVRKEVNFEIRTNTINQNVPYDLKSVMHYGPTAFSKNGKNTIITRDPFRQLDIGQRRELSFYDVKLANIHYKCNKHCSSKLVCYNDGFVDKNCRCRCPPNYTGKRCEYSGCGITITRSGTLTTPNFPLNYPENSKCIWRIQAPSGSMNIKVTFEEFDLIEPWPNSNYITACWGDRVEVRTGDSYKGETYCGNDLKGKTLTSTGKEMWIMFYSKYNDNKGFKANVDFTN